MTPNKKRRLKRAALKGLNIWRLAPAYLCAMSTPGKAREIIVEEIFFWGKTVNREEKGRFSLFCGLMLDYREYRSLLHYRMRRAGFLPRSVVKLLFPGQTALYIRTKEIGPRFFIHHGFSTIITAERIGSDCWVNQQVTIGHTTKDGIPVIGNGVKSTSGAKVLGPVTIGDNAIVGANAVVVKDVAEQEIVGGVPAKRIGINTDRIRYIRP